MTSISAHEQGGTEAECKRQKRQLENESPGPIHVLILCYLTFISLLRSS